MVIPLILIFLIIIVVICDNYQKLLGLPGPLNLPMVGALLWIDQKTPHLSLSKMAQKYGKLFGLKMGLFYTVVVTDARLLRKILSKNETVARPRLPLFTLMFNEKGIISSRGDVCARNRKFAINFLKESGVAVSRSRKHLERHILQSAENFVKETESQGNGMAIDPMDSIQFYTSFIITGVLYGKPIQREDEDWKIIADSLHKVAQISSLAGVVNFLPFLRVLPVFKNSLKEMAKAIDAINSVSDKFISKQLETKSSQDVSFGVINAYFKESSANSNIDTETIKRILFDMIGGSVETTAESLAWTVLYLAAFPKVQNKLRHELFQILQDKEVEFDDLSLLPYARATISEVYRIRSPVPLGAPHYALETFRIDDFEIPKGAMIMPILWSIHMNPEVWDSPEKFRPERFLDDEGKFNKSDNLVPFQAGKKSCIGEDLARMVTFMFVATVFRKFEISVEGDADFTPNCKTTMTCQRHKFIFKKL